MEISAGDSGTPTPALVVVGGSAGGVEALLSMVGKLPGDLPAAVLVVVHMSSSAPSVLAGILDRAGSLPAEQAVDGDAPRPGRIYVAVPGHHLLVRQGRLRVVRGPRESGHRPAIDPLFRSAAQERGAGCVGIVLSGNLDDGATGLAVIARAGGATLVQDPADAPFPGMPKAALAAVPGAIVAPAGELAEHLDRLVRERAPADGTGDTGWREPNERELAIAEEGGRPGTARLGPVSGYVCPDCGGSLYEIDDPTGVLHFRCRVGHAWAPESLAVAQDRAVENALWHAARVLREKAALHRRMADSAAQRGSRRLADSSEQAARDAERSAELIEAQLAGGSAGPGSP